MDTDAHSQREAGTDDVFIDVGQHLFPISQALAGALSKWHLTLVFALPGVPVLLMTVWMIFQPELKVFSASLTKAEAER